MRDDMTDTDFEGTNAQSLYFQIAAIFNILQVYLLIQNDQTNLSIHERASNSGDLVATQLWQLRAKESTTDNDRTEQTSNQSQHTNKLRTSSKNTWHRSRSKDMQGTKVKHPAL